MEEDRY